jgi:DNA-binding NtrC family response regulator
VLAMHFAEKYATELGKSIKHITEDTAALMLAYRWPGNIRELRNIMERAVLLADGSIIRPEHLPEGFRKNAPQTTSAHTAAAVPESALSIEDYTKQTIIRCQDSLGEQQIADLLGITRKSLWEKRKRWGIRRPGDTNEDD